MRRMHDPKFEKEVQQKLQELSFSPSEAVWTNIERAVGGEKKRRVPVFWIFLLSALTMTGTGLVYFSTRTGMAHREIANHAAASPAPAAGTVATERTTTTAEKSTITADRITTADEPITTDKVVTTAGKTTAIADKAATPSPRDIHTKNAPVPAVTMAQGGGGIPSVEGRSRQQAEMAANGRTAQQADVTPAAAEKANLPALNVFDHRFIVSAAPRLSSRSQAATAANAPIQLTPKYSWEAGFAGGIGVSALNRTLFQEPSAVAVASVAAPSPAAQPRRPRQMRRGPITRRWRRQTFSTEPRKESFPSRIGITFQCLICSISATHPGNRLRRHRPV